MATCTGPLLGRTFPVGGPEMRVFRRKSPRTGRLSTRYSYEFWRGKKRFQGSCRVSDKEAAELILVRRVNEVELRQAGLEDFRARRRPLHELVDEYRAELFRRRDTERHVNQTTTVIVRVLGLMRAHTLEEWTADRIASALAVLTGNARTQNFARGSLFAFSKWLVRVKRAIAFNPVDAITRAKEVPTFERRALAPAELARLVAGVPLERSVVYLCAGMTGLRRGELERLAIGDLDLENALVTVRAASAKNRKRAVLPVARALVERLREWLRARLAGKNLGPRLLAELRVFKRIPSVGELRDDLRGLGIPVETPEGRFDFHALRVTFGTNLARAGVPLTVTQRLMRHSDPRLTARFYVRHTLDEARAAAERAAALMGAVDPQRVHTLEEVRSAVERAAELLRRVEARREEAA